MDLTQESRRIRLNTALGENALGVRAMRMEEGLSRLFEMEIEAVSDSTDVDFDALLGRNLTLSMDTDIDGEPRHFNGYVIRAAHLGPRDRRLGVRLTAAPWLWFLTLSQTCRIFEDKSAPDIIAEVLDAHGLGEYELNMAGQHPTYTYCVQYNESDFNFISRLMEREGMYYYWEHANGSHKLIIVDSMTAHEPQPGYETFKFENAGSTEEAFEEAVTAWRPRREVRPTFYASTDYNYSSPGADLGNEASISRSHDAASFGVYEFPGNWAEAGDGDTYARMRAQALQTDHARIDAEGSVRGAVPGRIFTLSEHPVDAFNLEYLVVSVVHDLTAPAYESGGDATERYACRFEAMPRTEIFRAKRTTPLPRVQGPQTAVVTGESGKELDVDDQGRVRVTFHWLLGTPSCRVRVGQAWAGAGYGAMFWPRIGDEVLVGFLGGDPDRPIIVGSVYNGANMPPYDPVSMATVTTIKTNSSTGGGGFNELRFEDKKGEENIFLHAEKDLDIRVKDTARALYGNELHEDIGKNALRTIGEERHEIVGKDAFEEIAENHHVTVGGDAMRDVGGAANETVGGDMSITVGGKLQAGAGADLLLEGGSNVVTTAGQTVHIKAGQSVVIEAPMGVSLVCGGNFVTVGMAGVDIKGTMVNINTGGAKGSGPGTKPAKAKKPEKPKAPAKAKTAEPGEVSQPAPDRPRQLSPTELDAHPTAAALRRAAESGAPFCEECAKAAAAAAES